MRLFGQRVGGKNTLPAIQRDSLPHLSNEVASTKMNCGRGTLLVAGRWIFPGLRVGADDSGRRKDQALSSLW
jgi:hypothetical protein